MVPVLQLSTLLPLQRSGLLLCCQRFELSCLSAQPPQGCVYTSYTTGGGRQGRTRTYVVSNVRDLQSRAFATQLHLTIKNKKIASISLTFPLWCPKKSELRYFFIRAVADGHLCDLLLLDDIFLNDQRRSRLRI